MLSLAIAGVSSQCNRRAMLVKASLFVRYTYCTHGEGPRNPAVGAVFPAAGRLCSCFDDIQLVSHYQYRLSPWPLLPAPAPALAYGPASASKTSPYPVRWIQTSHNLIGGSAMLPICCSVRTLTAAYQGPTSDPLPSPHPLPHPPTIRASPYGAV